MVAVVILMCYGACYGVYNGVLF